MRCRQRWLALTKFLLITWSVPAFSPLAGRRSSVWPASYADAPISSKARLSAPSAARQGSVIAADEADELALDLHPVGAEQARLIGRVRGFESDRRALAPEALQPDVAACCPTGIRSGADFRWGR